MESLNLQSCSGANEACTTRFECCTCDGPEFIECDSSCCNGGPISEGFCGPEIEAPDITLEAGCCEDLSADQERFIDACCLVLYMCCDTAPNSGFDNPSCDPACCSEFNLEECCDIDGETPLCTFDDCPAEVVDPNPSPCADEIETCDSFLNVECEGCCPITEGDNSNWASQCCDVIAACCDDFSDLSTCNEDCCEDVGMEECCGFNTPTCEFTSCGANSIDTTCHNERTACNAELGLRETIFAACSIASGDNTMFADACCSTMQAAECSNGDNFDSPSSCNVESCAEFGDERCCTSEATCIFDDCPEVDVSRFL